MANDQPPVDPDGAAEVGEIMAAIDDDGSNRRLVIADVSTDGSWLSAPTHASISVAEAR